jgi:hypothetical protein
MSVYTKVKALIPVKTIHLKMPDICLTNKSIFPFNPNILLHKDRTSYLVNVRTANYVPGCYAVREGSETPYINTRNVVYVLDKDMKLVEEHELVDKCVEPPFHHTYLPHGYEDLRMFWWKGELFFLCVFCLYTDNFTPQICLCHINTDRWEVDARMLLAVKPNQCEKNWMPLVLDDNLYVVYKPVPLTVYKVNDSNWTLDLVMEKSHMSPVMNTLRGSGTPCRLLSNNFFLGVTHEVVFVNDKRVYLHRFILYDNAFLDEEEVSEPFVFFHHGIEFCCGLSLSVDGTNAILSVGVEDEDAFLVVMSVDTILRDYFSIKSD